MLSIAGRDLAVCGICKGSNPVHVLKTKNDKRVTICDFCHRAEAFALVCPACHASFPLPLPFDPETRCSYCGWHP